MAEHDVQRTEPKRDPCGKEPRESTCVAVVFYTEYYTYWYFYQSVSSI